MLHLLSSPPVYRRLKDEIAAAIREGRISQPVTDAEAKTLPYLHVFPLFLSLFLFTSLFSSLSSSCFSSLSSSLLHQIRYSP